jgi:hypothetical protein
MVEKTRKIVFFLDTCLGNSKIAGAMRAMGISVETHDQHFRKNASDIEWIPQIAEKEWVILTKDERIGKNALERQVVARTGLRMFTFTSQQLSGDDMVKILQKATISMQKFIEDNAPPFIAKIHKDGSVKKWKTAQDLLDEINNLS